MQTERESSVVSRSRDGEQDRTANRYRTKSVNVNSKQPPNQKKANHCHQNMLEAAGLSVVEEYEDVGENHYFDAFKAK